MVEENSLMAPLEARHPFEGIAQESGKAQLRGVTDVSIVSLAVPANGEVKLNKALKNAVGVSLAEPGKSTVSADGLVRLIWTTPEQYLLIFPRKSDFPVRELTEKIGATAYLTDQSDSWAILDLDGEESRKALERICPLDLESSNFEIDSAARTVMEHIGSIMIRTAKNRFRLLCARSYANSFLHAVETSVSYVS